MQRSYKTILLFLVVIGAALAGLVYVEAFVPFDYQHHPTKCFSCESQFTPDMAWMGQPTKCFDCEKEQIQQGQSPLGAHPLTYYEQTL